ncbi:hypothetical protein ACFQMM_03340 [Saliphagus sp. GCM10025308]
MSSKNRRERAEAVRTVVESNPEAVDVDELTDLLVSESRRPAGLRSRPIRPSPRTDHRSPTTSVTASRPTSLTTRPTFASERR